MATKTILKTTASVRRNGVDDPRRPGGVVTISAPRRAIEQLIEKHPELDGLVEASVHLIFRKNAPMQTFPSTGEAMATEGFELELRSTGKRKKADRIALDLLTAAERDEAQARRTADVAGEA